MSTPDASASSIASFYPKLSRAQRSAARAGWSRMRAAVLTDRPIGMSNDVYVIDLAEGPHGVIHERPGDGDVVEYDVGPDPLAGLGPEYGKQCPAPSDDFVDVVRPRAGDVEVLVDPRVVPQGGVPHGRERQAELPEAHHDLALGRLDRVQHHGQYALAAVQDRGPGVRPRGREGADVGTLRGEDGRPLGVFVSPTQAVVVAEGVSFPLQPDYREERDEAKRPADGGTGEVLLLRYEDRVGVVGERAVPVVRHDTVR
mmetsp:Transcript_58512/g.124130  ORF Transcript_58512/g.124130 Transcript_58512/m.124130 type:complete len:257 (+) Transcript_58512:435-1205(+)